MRKTGNYPSALYSILLLLAAFATTALHAQKINVQATVTESQVFSGEYVELKITVSGEGFKRLTKPDLPASIQGFRIVSTNPSTSRSIQIINGQTSSSYTYGYYLIAEVAGTHSIPSISIEVDGVNYKTEPISIQVIDRNQAASGKNSNNNAAAESDKPDIYLRMEVNDKSPVVGQQLVVDLVLYFKSTVDIQSYSPIPGWKAEGFWKEELNNPSRPTTTGVIIDGIRYRKAQLLQYALFPTKSGDLEISPFEIGVNVRYSTNRRDPFSSVFGGFGTNQRNVNLKSNSIKLKVKSYDVPENVLDVGAVGNFRISRDLSMRDLVEGETIEIITQFSGDGNIPLISKPNYQLPSSVEVYEPQEKSTINRNNGKISGRKLFTELVVARTAGEYEIPARKLGFFDPASNRYKQIELPALVFNVKPDARLRTADNSLVTRLTVQPYLGLANWVYVEQNGFSGFFYFLAVLPFIALIGGYFYKRYSDRIGSDTAFARMQKSDKMARERLNLAHEKAKDNEIKDAYSMIHTALCLYVADRTNHPEAGLSDKQYADIALDHGLAKQEVDTLYQLLQKCSTIRFAPNTGLKDFEDDQQKAEALIKAMKTSLKKAKVA